MWVEQIVSTMGYTGIALMMFVENIFPPIPSEVIMPFAGFLVNKGEMSLAGVLIAGTSGALAGAVAIYYIGVWIERSRIRHWFKEYGKYLLMSENDFDKAIDTFNHHGKKMILIGRVIPTIRSLISFPAGLERMNLGIFLFFTALGTAIWNVLLTYAGVILGQNWESVLSIIDKYEFAVWIILAGLAAFFVIKRVRSWSFSN